MAGIGLERIGKGGLEPRHDFLGKNACPAHSGNQPKTHQQHDALGSNLSILSALVKSDHRGRLAQRIKQHHAQHDQPRRTHPVHLVSSEHLLEQRDIQDRIQQMPEKNAAGNDENDQPEELQRQKGSRTGCPVLERNDETCGEEGNGKFRGGRGIDEPQQRNRRTQN